MELFKNNYRIKSARLPHWDYTSEGYYFVTLCTKNKEPFLGAIKNGVMQISEIGQIVTEEWLATEFVRKNVTLDEWVVSTTLKSGSLGSIIGQFKSIATKRIREKGYSDFVWQPRYYDHIVRNNKSLNRIRNYIQFNTEKWEYDGENQNDIASEVK